MMTNGSSRAKITQPKSPNTCLDQQLTEAAFLHEDDHTVEGQHQPKRNSHLAGGDRVVEVQQVVRRERQQRRRERDPSVGRDAAERQIREDRRP